MALYRKRPVIINAFQVTKELVRAWANKELERPIEVCELDVWWHTPRPCTAKDKLVINEELSSFSGKIQTLEGTMQFNVGDWIITGIKGEKYPRKDEIFKATYELVNEPGIIGEQNEEKRNTI